MSINPGLLVGGWSCIVSFIQTARHVGELVLQYFQCNCFVWNWVFTKEMELLWFYYFMFWTCI